MSLAAQGALAHQGQYPTAWNTLLPAKSKMADGDHCKLLQLKNKLQGKAVTHSEKLEWWIISMVDCVTILQ